MHIFAIDIDYESQIFDITPNSYLRCEMTIEREKIILQVNFLVNSDNLLRNDGKVCSSVEKK